MTLLYFAYGSNLLHERLQKRVPSAKYLETATLPGYVLRFNKISKDGSSKANIERSSDPDDTVFGVLYEMDEADRRRLDKVEGLGRGYELLRAQVQTSNGPRVAFTYTGSAGSLDDTVRPYLWYKRILIRGARQNHLPQAYINQILSVPTVDDPTRA